MSKLDIFCRNWEVLLFLGYREEDILDIRIRRGNDLISNILIIMDDGEEYDLLLVEGEEYDDGL